MSFLLNLFRNKYTITLRTNKQNMAGFNENNNYTLYLTANGGETLYDVLRNFNNFRSPRNQINFNQINNVTINRNMVIYV